jgi:hypothetical protein
VKEILRITSAKTRPRIAFDQGIQSGAADYRAVLGSDFAKLNGSIVSMSRNDPTEEFSAAYKSKYGTLPPYGADIGYNSFLVLASTYDRDPKKWTSNITKTEFLGADGPVSFTTGGYRAPRIHFGTLKNGKVI